MDLKAGGLQLTGNTQKYFPMTSGFGILSQAINRAGPSAALGRAGVRATHSPRVRTLGRWGLRLSPNIAVATEACEKLEQIHRERRLEDEACGYSLPPTDTCPSDQSEDRTPVSVC